MVSIQDVFYARRIHHVKLWCWFPDNLVHIFKVLKPYWPKEPFGQLIIFGNISLLFYMIFSVHVFSYYKFEPSWKLCIFMSLCSLVKHTRSPDSPTSYENLLYNASIIFNLVLNASYAEKSRQTTVQLDTILTGIFSLLTRSKMNSSS